MRTHNYERTTVFLCVLWLPLQQHICRHSLMRCPGTLWLKRICLDNDLTLGLSMFLLAAEKFIFTRNFCSSVNLDVRDVIPLNFSQKSYSKFPYTPIPPAIVCAKFLLCFLLRNRTFGTFGRINIAITTFLLHPNISMKTFFYMFCGLKTANKDVNVLIGANSAQNFPWFQIYLDNHGVKLNKSCYNCELPTKWRQQ